MNLGGWEIVILIGVLILVFGAKRLPDMARSIGQSARVFKGEMKGLKDDAPQKDDTPATPPPAAAQEPAPLPPAAAPPAPVHEPSPTTGQSHPTTGQ